jgi:hypothetical protein
MDLWLAKDQLLDGLRALVRFPLVLLARLTRPPRLDWDEIEPLDDVLDEWHQGKDDHIPVCCRVRACWDYHRNRSPVYRRGIKVRPGVTPDVFVPCGVFHQGRPAPEVIKELE